MYLQGSVFAGMCVSTRVLMSVCLTVDMHVCVHVPLLMDKDVCVCLRMCTRMSASVIVEHKALSPSGVAPPGSTAQTSPHLPLLHAPDPSSSWHQKSIPAPAGQGRNLRQL